MTDEQLQKELQEANDKLNALANAEKPLTKEQQKERSRFQFRKVVLTQIKEARAKNQKSAELYNTIVYDMLTSWGERHPILLFLATNIMRTRFSSGAFRM